METCYHEAGHGVIERACGKLVSAITCGIRDTAGWAMPVVLHGEKVGVTRYYDEIAEGPASTDQTKTPTAIRFPSTSEPTKSTT
jgi:hypothetical protein